MKPNDAIRHFGTQKAIADALGVTEGAVSQWASDNDGKTPRIPALQQLRLETITNGVLMADDDVPRGHRGRKRK